MSEPLSPDDAHRPIRERDHEWGGWAVGCSCGEPTCDLDLWREHYEQELRAALGGDDE